MMRSVVKHFSFTGTPDIERAHLRNSIRTQLSGYFLDDIPENIDLLLGEEGRGLLDGHRLTAHTLVKISFNFFPCYLLYQLPLTLLT